MFYMVINPYGGDEGCFSFGTFEAAKKFYEEREDDDDEWLLVKVLGNTDNGVLLDETEVLRQALHIAVGKLEEIKAIGDDVYLPPWMNPFSLCSILRGYYEKVTEIIRDVHNG